MKARDKERKDTHVLTAVIAVGLFTFVALVGFIAVSAVLEQVHISLSASKFCESEGFDAGGYYEYAEGIYCWNHVSVIRADGSTYQGEIDRTFYPDKKEAKA